MDDDLQAYLAESNEALLNAAPDLGAGPIAPSVTRILRPSKPAGAPPPPSSKAYVPNRPKASSPGVPPRPAVQPQRAAASAKPSNGLPLIPEIVLGPPPPEALPTRADVAPPQDLQPQDPPRGPAEPTPAQQERRSSGGGTLVGLGLLAVLAFWWLGRQRSKASLSSTGPAPVPVGPLLPARRKAKT